MKKKDKNCSNYDLVVPYKPKKTIKIKARLKKVETNFKVVID